MLCAHSLSKTYQDPAGEVSALKTFDHCFEQGKMTAIMGPSGSGKSTLLNILAGLDVPSGGRVLLDGEDISRLSEQDRAEIRLKRFGFVFQSFNLVRVLNAWQNVAFPMGLAGIELGERKARAKELLKRFGLSHRYNHLPYKLSGGERQRVSIARALANNPDIIFADEPTGNLDTRSGDVVVEALRDIALEGRSIIVVTHDGRLAEQADHVLRLQDGSLLVPSPQTPVDREAEVYA